MIVIITHGVSTPVTFVVIEMPSSSNFLITLGRPCLRDMNAIHDWSRNQIQIHRYGNIVVIPVAWFLTRAKANQVQYSAGTNCVNTLSHKQDSLVFQANHDLISLAESHLARLIPEQEKLNILEYYSKGVLETVSTDAMPATHALYKKNITRWTHGVKDRVLE